MSVYLTHGEDGAVLCDVIGAADAMNHAIPTCGELSRALTSLATHGVLYEIDGKYRIVDNYLPAIGKANDGKGGLFSTPDKGKKWLVRTELTPTKKVTIDISDEQLAAACDHYRKLLRQK